MRCITLWQPWASLWLTTAKVHETRSWQTLHRGPLAVHAARRPVDWNLDFDLHNLCIDYLGQHYESQLPRGVILGVIELIDCYASDEHGPVDMQDRICGDFKPGRFLWRRRGFTCLAHPVPHVGRQGLWNAPNNLLDLPLWAARTEALEEALTKKTEKD